MVFPDACQGYAPESAGPGPLSALAVKPLVPERMPLPLRGATLDLSEWLPEPTKSEFLNPRLIRRRDLPAAPQSRYEVEGLGGLTPAIGSFEHAYACAVVRSATQWLRKGSAHWRVRIAQRRRMGPCRL